jgi:hypothetical protein
MTPDIDMHRPTATFRDGLEAEIVRALRREERIAVPGPWRGRLRNLTRLAAAVLLGVAAGATPAQVQDARQRDSLLAATQAEARLMALRLQVLREELATGTRRVEAGIIARSSLAATEADMRAAELRLRALQIDMEEIKATSGQPRDDMAAPRIAGRDFVKERLQLEAMAAQRTMAAAEEAMQEARRRQAAGIESPVALQEAQVELEKRLAAAALLAEKLRLRDRFVDSSVAVKEMKLEVRRLELRSALGLAQRQAALAAARLDLVRERASNGVATRADLLRAELDVLERKAEMERIEAQLRALRPPEGGTR